MKFLFIELEGRKKYYVLLNLSFLNDSVAGNQNRIGNGYCDDENNNDECNFDGGDCCLDIVETYFCTICQCFEGEN